MISKTPKFAVLGSARETENSPVSKLALQLGREIGLIGGILLTGGCPGLPNMATLGAKAVSGLTVTISPGANIKEHTQSYGYPNSSDVMIFTGMGNKGRNVILVRSADICIFIGGGIGTLNEYTIAFDELSEENVIGILSKSGGLSSTFRELARLTNRVPKASIVTDEDPRMLVQKSFSEFDLSGHRLGQ
ncbi:MAG: hypothetical protein V1897_13065 [Pseudomonadota bacterium]